MALSKNAFNAITKALRNLALEVNLNATWQKIHDELGVGVLSKKKLLLTRDDHEQLRNWASLEAGADPLTTDVTGDRLQAASLVRDEKWATDTVFAGMMQVNCISSDIALAQGNTVTPQGTLLSVPADDILLDGIDAVVLVENGIIARYWHKCRVPEELASALMVYRGHSSDAQTVRRWLSSLPAGVRKVGYFDFDPAGLGMSIDYGVDAILIPDPLTDELVTGINNKPDAHHEQILRRPEIRNQLPEPIREIWDWMTTDGRKCAVTQERLMLMNYSLRILPITNQTNKGLA